MCAAHLGMGAFRSRPEPKPFEDLPPPSERRAPWGAQAEAAVLEHARQLAQRAVRSGRVVANRYLVDRILARGQRGVVLAVTDLRTDRPLALRLVRPAPTSVRAALLEEARFCASLQNPHIARVVDAGESHDEAYLVRERVDGASVRRLARESGGLGLDEALDLFGQVALAVIAVHRGGRVLHDLHAGQVRTRPLATGELHAKLCDLSASGPAGPTGTFEMWLDPRASAAPEVIAGRRGDPQSDVWSLGVLLYELLAGGPPFGSSPSRMVEAIFEHPPTPLAHVRPDLPRRLLPVVEVGLAKRTADRPGSVADMAESLMRFAKGATRRRLEDVIAAGRETDAVPASAASSAPTAKRAARRSLPPPRGSHCRAVNAVVASEDKSTGRAS